MKYACSMSCPRAVSNPRRSASRAAILAASALLAATASAFGQPSFTVTIDDPQGLFGAHGPNLQAAALAAARLWGEHLDTAASIEIVVHPDTGVERGYGRSYIAVFREAVGDLFIADQGMGAEVRTGIDPNGTDPDVEIAFNPAYVFEQFWYDPDPIARTAPVPGNRLDAVSVMMHEIGHALLYNGYINDVDGSYFDNFRSTFDFLTAFDGTDFTFTGQACTNVYGGPGGGGGGGGVPLTFGNTDHWGNPAPGPGSDLIPQLMNGVVFMFGTRYHVSPLDRAAISDCGLPLRSLCAADINGDGNLDPDDLSDYIACYFTTPPCDQADYSGNGSIDPDDLSDYIGAYFQGC